MVASILVVAASVLALADGRGGGGPDPTCEPIKIDMCRSLGYNMTGMPNLAMNSRQSDAAQNLETWSPLIGTRYLTSISVQINKIPSFCEKYHWSECLKMAKSSPL